MKGIDRLKCVENAGGQHDLVLMAAHRARQLDNGAEPRVDNVEGHKNTVVALMEIEQGLWTSDDYKARLIKKGLLDEDYFSL